MGPLLEDVDCKIADDDEGGGMDRMSKREIEQDADAGIGGGRDGTVAAKKQRLISNNKQEQQLETSLASTSALPNPKPAKHFGLAPSISSSTYPSPSAHNLASIMRAQHIGSTLSVADRGLGRPQTSAGPAVGGMGMNERKKLEQERLARRQEKADAQEAAPQQAPDRASSSASSSATARTSAWSSARASSSYSGTSPETSPDVQSSIDADAALARQLAAEDGQDLSMLEADAAYARQLAEEYDQQLPPAPAMTSSSSSSRLGPPSRPAPSRPAVVDMDADEAYARQLQAEEEEAYARDQKPEVKSHVTQSAQQAQTMAPEPSTSTQAQRWFPQPLPALALPHPKPKPLKPVAARPVPQNAVAVQRFTDGAVRQCSTTSGPGDLTLEAIFSSSSDMEHSIICSKDWDSTKLVKERLSLSPTCTSTWIMPKSVRDKLQIPEFVSACIVPQVGESLVNASFFILIHKNFCRVVISTSSSFDWSAGGHSLYIHDFKKALGSTPQTEHSLNKTHQPCSLSLIVALQQLGVPRGVVNNLARFNYNKATDLQLLFNRPLSPKSLLAGTELEKFYLCGVTGLVIAMNELGARPKAPGDRWTIEFCSPLVEPSETLLRQIALAATGVDPQTTSWSEEIDFDWSAVEFNIVVPTQAAVDRILQSGFKYENKEGALMKKLEDWDRIRKRLYQAESKKGPSSLVRGSYLAIKLTHAVGDPEAFLYIGSANLTPASWRPLSPLNGRPILEGSWDMGVMLRLPGRTDDELERSISEKVAYSRPLRPYGPGDVPAAGQLKN